MKNPIKLFAITVLFSCNGTDGETSSNILENLTLTVDTVVVDPKSEIIDLSFGVNNSSVSSDGSTFYHFDIKQRLINSVNLDKLELAGIHQFFKEGPNSIGFNPPRIQSLPNDRILFASNGFGVGVYDLSGEKQKNLKFNFREIEGLNYEEEGLITNHAVVSEDERHLFALSMFDPSLSEVKLIVVDPEQKTGKTITLPVMKQALESIILWRAPGSFSRGPGGINLQLLNGKLYVISSVTSDVYQYDFGSDSLVLIEFPHRLVHSKKTGEFKNLVSSEKEFFEEMGKVIYQIGFEKLLWDEERKQFFRFALEPIPDEERKWYDRAEVYLFVYDSDLNLLGEKHLPQLSKVPEFPFFKDGKLWSYVNVDDELGFAVMDLNF